MNQLHMWEIHDSRWHECWRLRVWKTVLEITSVGGYNSRVGVLGTLRLGASNMGLVVLEAKSVKISNVGVASVGSQIYSGKGCGMLWITKMTSPHYLRMRDKCRMMRDQSIDIFVIRDGIYVL